MALVVKDRVKETTSSTGTGTITLTGAAPGFQSFSVIGNANTTYYTITNNTDWEVGIGTYTTSGTALSRDTVLESSNAGSLVNFGAGTKDVFVTYPAEESVYQDGASIAAGTSVLGVANGGTATNTQFTSGSVVFAGASGTYSQDNANLFWDNTNDRLGIGTSSPNCKLEVFGGTTWVRNFAGTPSSPTETQDWPVPALNIASYGDFTLQTMLAFTLPNDGNYFTGSSAWNFKLEQTASSTTSAGVAGMQFGGPGYLMFAAGQTERMRIDSSGNVGIGTSAPGAKLDVNGTINGASSFYLGTGLNNANSIEVGNGRTGSNYAYIDLIGDTTYTDFGLRIIRGNSGANASSELNHRGTGDFILSSVDAAPIRFNTNSTERMRIDSAGNVGIGVTSLYSGYNAGSYNLNISNASTVLWPNASGTWNTSTAGGAITYFNDNNLYIDAKDSTSNMIFRVNGATERMRIDSSGNVGIGTTGGSYKLQVNVASGANQIAYLENASAGSSLGGLAVSINSGGNNTNSYHFLGVTQGVAIWYLYGNGTTSYTSDIRVKKNVETTRDGYLDDISQLRVVKYNWYNDDDGTPRELGFIAQEVEQVFPGLVQDAAHPTKDGICHKVLKGSVMMPIMVKALQEANAKIDALAARVAQLEERT